MADWDGWVISFAPNTDHRHFGQVETTASQDKVVPQHVPLTQMMYTLSDLRYADDLTTIRKSHAGTAATRCIFNLAVVGVFAAKSPA